MYCLYPEYSPPLPRLLDLIFIGGYVAVDVVLEVVSRPFRRIRVETSKPLLLTLPAFTHGVLGNPMLSWVRILVRACHLVSRVNSNRMLNLKEPSRKAKSKPKVKLSCSLPFQIRITYLRSEKRYKFVGYGITEHVILGVPHPMDVRCYTGSSMLLRE